MQLWPKIARAGCESERRSDRFTRPSVSPRPYRPAPGACHERSPRRAQAILALQGQCTAGRPRRRLKIPQRSSTIRFYSTWSKIPWSAPILRSVTRTSTNIWKRNGLRGMQPCCRRSTKPSGTALAAPSSRIILAVLASLAEESLKPKILPNGVGRAEARPTSPSSTTLPLLRLAVWRWRGSCRQLTAGRCRSDPSPCGSCLCLASWMLVTFHR